MTPRYWSRQRRFSRADGALTLHFTWHPGDVVIRVALRNRAAHDIIHVPQHPTTHLLYTLVRDYTKALTKDEVAALARSLRRGVEAPTPQSYPHHLSTNPHTTLT